MMHPKFTDEQREKYRELFMGVDGVIDGQPKEIVFSLLGATLEHLIIDIAKDHNTALSLVFHFTERLVNNIDEAYGN